MQRGARFVFCRSVLMQRGARFWIFDVPLGVQHGVSEGVRNMYKTNVFLHILKNIEKDWHARSGDERPYCLKNVGKINTLSTRYGRSLAPTWAAPFFGVRNSGASMGLQ